MENNNNRLQKLLQEMNGLGKILNESKKMDDLNLKYIKVSMEFVTSVIDMRASQIKYDNLFYKGTGNVIEAAKEKEKYEEISDERLRAVVNLAKEIRDEYNSKN